jgi:hypothetical protein
LPSVFLLSLSVDQGYDVFQSLTQQIRTKTAGRKTRDIFTCLLVSSFPAAVFVMYSVAVISFIFSVYGGEIFP